MAFENNPEFVNFGDKYAKINKRVHSSGANIIEVLYGARDANGHPTYPERDANDGHGHWIALEIEGMYQMFSWRHPASEGGRQEYGTNRYDNALKDLENDLEAKERICIQAESLVYAKDLSAASRTLNSLFEEWKKIYNWHTPKEKVLWERFSSARKRFNERRESERNKNLYAKKAIISEASSLSSSSDWKKTGQRFTELLDKWKGIGSAGRDEDEILWQEFNSARKAFQDHRSRHFEEMENQFSRNRRAKQDLISEARSVSQYSNDWKGTTDRLGELMDKWKAVGSAGRDFDERLWNEFCHVRQDFFDRKHAHYEEQKRIFAANAERKNRLLQEASSIVGRIDYSQTATERMKEIDREWKNIGSAGRDEDERLWNSLKAVKDGFWTGKRSSSAQRQQERRMKMQDAIGRKRAQIYNLEGQISNLRMKMMGMKNQEYISNMYGWISEKEAKIRELEMAIRDMESKL